MQGWLHRQLCKLGNGRHALGGEHPPALELPVLVLLQQHRPHQASDGWVVGEDADNPGAVFGFLTVVKPPCGVIAL
jgi:hypothetical protein